MQDVQRVSEPNSREDFNVHRKNSNAVRICRKKMKGKIYIGAWILSEKYRYFMKTEKKMPIYYWTFRIINVQVLTLNHCEPNTVVWHTDVLCHVECEVNQTIRIKSVWWDCEHIMRVNIARELIRCNAPHLFVRFIHLHTHTQTARTGTNSAIGCSLRKQRPLNLMGKFSKHDDFYLLHHSNQIVCTRSPSTGTGARERRKRLKPIENRCFWLKL